MNSPDSDLPSGVMRCVAWWRRCPLCGRRIEVGDVQGLAPIGGGHRDWVCGSCCPLVEEVAA